MSLSILFALNCKNNSGPNYKFVSMRSLCEVHRMKALREGRGCPPVCLFVCRPVRISVSETTQSISTTRAVCKVRGLILLLRVGTSWRCGDGLFFEVPPLASDALLTTLHPLLENVLQTVCRKLQEDSGTGGFDLSRSFLRL
jgi:hypothetical protein